MKHLILFDFDGTLCDTVDAMVETINEVAKRHGYEEELTHDTIREMSTQQLIKHLGVPFWKVPLFLEEYKQTFLEKSKGAQLYPGIKELLEKLHTRARLGIVSTNDPEFIKTFLGKHGLRHLFSAVDGGAYFAKNLRISSLIRKFEMLSKNTVYIGDETRDVHSARRAKVNGIAVTWGLQSENILSTIRPQMLAKDVKELEKLLFDWLVK